MAQTVDDETALEEVMAYLDRPPAAGSADDQRFGERLRQVLAAGLPDDDTPDETAAPARLALAEDLRLRLEAAARARTARFPFGENPDGLGPTLGMSLRGN